MRRRVAVFVMAALVAVGCSSSEDGVADDAASGSSVDDADGTAPDAADGSADSAPEDDDATSGGDDGELTTDDILEMFPVINGTDQYAFQAQLADEARQRQLLLAECMMAQGFEYKPVDYDSVFSFDPAEGLDHTSREYAEHHGFGFISDNMFAEEYAMELLIPNMKYLDSLSPEAQDAYYEALQGSPPELDSSITVEEMDAMSEENPEIWEPQGCAGEAFNLVSSFADFFRIHEEFGDQIESMEERMEADPRVVEFEADWAECMAEAGYSYASPDDIFEELTNKMDELRDGYEPPSLLSEAEIEAMTKLELFEYFSLTVRDPEGLTGLQEFERAIAVASWDCGWVSQNDFFEEIFAEYMRELIEENLDAIRALLAGEG